MASWHPNLSFFDILKFILVTERIIAKLLKKEQYETNIIMNYKYWLNLQVTHHINLYSPVITWFSVNWLLN